MNVLRFAVNVNRRTNNDTARKCANVYTINEKVK